MESGAWFQRNLDVTMNYRRWPRYCDECGAALWLAGKSGGLSLPGSKNNGSDGNGSKDAAATVAQSRGKASSSVMSEQQTSAPLVESGNRVHATLVIERGNSAGK